MSSEQNKRSSATPSRSPRRGTSPSSTSSWRATTSDTIRPIRSRSAAWKASRSSSRPTARRFPDARITVEQQLAEGDLVATRWSGRGTHEGELMGIEPAGKQVTVSGVTISRLEGGKIVEEFLNWDTFGMMQQLDAFPQSPTPNNPPVPVEGPPSGGPSLSRHRGAA
jgi:predicted ester cyclase